MTPDVIWVTSSGRVGLPVGIHAEKQSDALQSGMGNHFNSCLHNSSHWTAVCLILFFFLFSFFFFKPFIKKQISSNDERKLSFSPVGYFKRRPLFFPLFFFDYSEPID